MCATIETHTRTDCYQISFFHAAHSDSQHLHLLNLFVNLIGIGEVVEAAARAEANKKVLILMSGTGGRHRASAELISLPSSKSSARTTRCGFAAIFGDNNLYTIADVALQALRSITIVVLHYMLVHS